ncbi:MAG: hypothetical protein LC122_11700 [Chitinophagales bacterium]|nr:hypothetical protein [Chitinophagales bacterium]
MIIKKALERNLCPCCENVLCGIEFYKCNKDCWASIYKMGNRMQVHNQYYNNFTLNFSIDVLPDLFPIYYWLFIGEEMVDSVKVSKDGRIISPLNIEMDFWDIVNYFKKFCENVDLL